MPVPAPDAERRAEPVAEQPEPAVAPVGGAAVLAPLASTDSLMALQATAGNRSVTSMLLRQPAPTKAPPKKTTVADPVEETWQALLAFSARATPELARVGKRVEEYLTRYDAAFGRFSKRLDKAQKEAAEREKWASAMTGLIIGVYVGLASGGLYTAATFFGKLAMESVEGAASLGIGKAIGSPTSTVDFKAPAELNNDKVARGQLQLLVQAWQAVSIVQAATLALSNRRDAARGGKADPKLAAEFGALKNALDQTDRALTVFLTTVDTPLLSRSEVQLEQDMWIKWMSRARANAAAMQTDETIGERGRQIGIYGRVAEPGTMLDMRGEALQPLAAAEQSRIEKIGAVAVVILPARPPTGNRQRRPGVIRIRGDAYSAAGRAVPPQGALEYARLAYQEATFLRPGEVVMVTGTAPSGLQVDRLGPELGVTANERQDALRMLGIKENEYEPEAAEMLYPLVWNALEVLRYEAPGLQTTKSEDGITVAAPDGTKLVLFAPLTQSDWVGGAARRDRTKVPKVVLVNFDRNLRAKDSRAAGVVVLERSDAYTLANEIREMLPKQAKPAAR